MSSIKAWVIAARPFALPVFFLIPLVGYVLQYKSISIDSIVLAFGTMIVGLFVHFYNDYDDFVRGVDKLSDGSNPKAYTQASQILPRGLIKPSHMLYASMITVMIALLIGGWVLLRYRYVAAFGILGFLFSISYNVMSFKYHALGGVSFGGALASALLVGATMHTFSISPVIIILAIFFAYAGFITVNIDSYYDIEQDRKNNVVSFPILHKRLFEKLTVASIPVSIFLSIVLLLVPSNYLIDTIIATMMIMVSCFFYKSLSDDRMMGIIVIAITIFAIIIIMLC